LRKERRVNLGLKSKKRKLLSKGYQKKRQKVDKTARKKIGQAKIE